MAISKQAIEYAQKNPNSPTSQEILRRAGLLNIKTSEKGTNSTGLAKSLVGGAVGLASGLQRFGQKALAAVIPGKSYEDIRQTTGFKSLDSTTREGAYVKEVLKPDKGEGLGYFAGEVAQFAIPGTKVAKATQKLSFIPRIVTRAAGDATVGLAKSGGDIGEAAKVGGISAGIQAGTGIAGLGLRFLGNIFKGVAGVGTGRGTAVIDEILKNPQTAKEGLRQPVLQTLKSDAGKITNYVQTFRKASQQNYQKALEELPKRLGTPTALKAGAKTTVKDGGKLIKLSMQGVKSRWTKSLKNLGVDINPNTKELNFLSTTLPKSYEGKLKEISSVFNGWKDTSPAGLNKLATKIDNYKVLGETSTDKLFNKIVGNMKNGVRNYVGKRIPAVNTLNIRYSQEQKFLKELQTHVSKIGDLKDDPVMLKNITQKLNTLFTKNKELSREVLEKIPGGSGILSRQAGRELAETIPRSGAAIGDLARGLIQSVIPPRWIGEITAFTGISQQKLAPLVQTLSQLSPVERATLFSFFSFLNQQSGSQQNEQ